MRGILFLVGASVLLAQDDLVANRQRIRVAVDNMSAHNKRLGDFLFERHSDRKEFSSDGKLKSSLSTHFRRDPWDELVVTRLIARNGTPLSKAEVAQQEVRLQKLVADQRRKRPTGDAVNGEDDWLVEMPEAMDYRRKTTEQYEGRTTDIFEFSPRPGYQAKHMRAKAFEKVRGTVWIDRTDGEIAKLDAVVFETVNIGFGVLGRLEKGTHFELERRKATSDHWFNVWQRVRFEAKVMMVKSIRQELENRWSNFSRRTTLSAK